MSKKLNKQAGFTIIEVLIVLAIAGVIMLIVFLAVPALQRNSRNTQRRSDAAHLAGIVNEYAANHAGILPDGGQLVTATSNEKFSIIDQPVATDLILPFGTINKTGTTTSVKVHPGTTCDIGSANLNGTNVSKKSFSVEFRVETSGGDDPTCMNG